MVKTWKCLLEDCEEKAQRLIDNRGFCNKHPDSGNETIGYYVNSKFYSNMGKIMEDEWTA